MSSIFGLGSHSITIGFNEKMSMNAAEAYAGEYARWLLNVRWEHETYDFKVGGFLRTASPHWLAVMTDIEIGIWETARLADG